MTQRIKALIEPELLTWARESIGYSRDEASNKIGITPERLAGWESGDSQPTVLQLKKAAWVYRRPFAAFYLPEPPEDVDLTIKDFRRLTGEDSAYMISSSSSLHRNRIAHEGFRLCRRDSA